MSNKVDWEVYDSVRFALRDYGRHKDGCPGDEGCSCGFVDTKWRHGVGWRPGDYVCECGRGQSGHNVGEEAVEAIGWRKIDGKWSCPFCTGNTENLKKVFTPDTGES